MAFDEGVNKQVIFAPDFDANLQVYNDKVAQIGEQIKAGQSQLASLQAQIEAAKAYVQAAYQAKISDLEDKIIELKNQITDLHSQKIICENNIVARQARHDAIQLEFHNRQAQLDSAQAQVEAQAQALAARQSQLNADQDAFEKAKDQLDADRKAFDQYQTTQQKVIDTTTATANDLFAKAQADSNAAKDLLDTANHRIAQADATEASLNSQIAVAQSILDTAAAVAAQKAQNEIDAKKNSADALRNDSDAKEIQVAKVVLNNQQVEYNNRMATLQQAEAALAAKSGG